MGLIVRVSSADSIHTIYTHYAVGTNKVTAAQGTTATPQPALALPHGPPSL
eukprot:SAG31_NODE_36238_length_315_cov_0.800926_1_plen_50_part_10